MAKALDLTGQTLGRLTVIRRAGNFPDGHVAWECRCSCGGTITTRSQLLREGRARSCGCLRRETASATGKLKTRHGMTGTRAHRRWSSMIERCTSPTCEAWPRYGGRGIKVCRRWRAFENFYADMGDPPPGASIEREDNDGPYSPANCVWATAENQSNNKSDNRRITFNGVTHTATQWARLVGVPRHVIYHRLDAGWDLARVLTRQRYTRWGPSSKPLK